MLSISFFDLAHNAINAVGFAAANVWLEAVVGSDLTTSFYTRVARTQFFAGVLLFAVVVTLIPEPVLVPEPAAAAGGQFLIWALVLDNSYGGDMYEVECFVICDSSHPGQPVGLGQSDSADCSRPCSRVPSVAQGHSQDEDDPKGLMKRRRKQVLYSGVITAVGISLHNFPEGVAVFLGSMKGVAVALPVYFATRDRWKAFRLAAFSGLAEPLGVVIVAHMLACMACMAWMAAMFFPDKLSPEFIEGMLGGVGGVMAFLTLHEMLPLAFEYAGHKMAVTAVFVGMAVMSASLHLLAMTLPPDVAL
eukprot:SM000176S03120  [mRNA]  locus=s176:67357:70390:- [translate_table: standard]